MQGRRCRECRRMGLKLGATTYTYVYACSLEDAIGRLADMGFRYMELAATWPHLVAAELDGAARQHLAQRCRSLGIHPVSMQPTYTDLNLASTNEAFRKESVRQLRENLELAADLGVENVVVVPGRVNALIPPPLETALALSVGCLESCLPLAERLGVTISLESAPFCIAPDSLSLLGIVRRLNHPSVKVTLDVANNGMVESPQEALRNVRDHLSLVHVSDTTRSQWLHAPVGDGELDFGAVARTLLEIGYRGVSILEALDRDAPDEVLSRSKPAMERLGWSA